jgi:hypothetical protein
MRLCGAPCRVEFSILVRAVLVVWEWTFTFPLVDVKQFVAGGNACWDPKDGEPLLFVNGEKPEEPPPMVEACRLVSILT